MTESLRTNAARTLDPLRAEELAAVSGGDAFDDWLYAATQRDSDDTAALFGSYGGDPLAAQSGGEVYGPPYPGDGSVDAAPADPGGYSCFGGPEWDCGYDSVDPDDDLGY